MENTNESKFTVLELGVSSGNNMVHLINQINSVTNNYIYFTQEHPSGFKESCEVQKGRQSEISAGGFSHVVNTEGTFEDIANFGTKETLNRTIDAPKFDGKADLVLATHCLAFVKQISLINLCKICAILLKMVESLWVKYILI